MNRISFLSRYRSADAAERERQTQSFGFKIYATGCLLLALVALGVIEWLSPDLWDYPFSTAFHVDAKSFVDYWPFLAWGLVLTAFGACVNEHRSTGNDERHFVASVALGAYAGVWEEIGYRCVFAAFAFFLAALFGAFWWCVAVVLLLVVGLSILGVFGDHRTTSAERTLAVLAIALVALGCWVMWRVGNPMFVLYDWVFAPIYSFLTWGALDPLLYNPETRDVAIGLTFANAWFREGHEYQGPVGYVNSWFAGFVLIHAAMTRGLWTAVALHAAYNAIVHAVIYLARRRHAALALA